MAQTSSMTQKGQITLPKSIRDKWGLEPSDKVVFIESGETVEVKPAENFLSLKGTVTTDKPFSDKEADIAVGQYIAHENKKNS